MAHRDNLISVDIDLKDKGESQMVTDPVCQKKMVRKDVRHELFRTEGIYYFCSQQCLNSFVSPQKAHPAEFSKNAERP